MGWNLWIDVRNCIVNAFADELVGVAKAFPMFEVFGEGGDMPVAVCVDDRLDFAKGPQCGLNVAFGRMAVKDPMK